MSGSPSARANDPRRRVSSGRVATQRSFTRRSSSTAYEEDGTPERDALPDLPARPDSRELAEALRAAIRDGRLAEGARVPSTRELARSLGVARGTVTRAYDQLATEGFLRTQQGAPTTVTEHLATAPAPTGPSRTSAEPSARWDFRPGRPDLSSFPRKDWLTAARRAMHTATPDDFDYGDPQGHPRLRTALAEYLTRTRAVVTDPGNIVICSGYNQALSLLSKALQEQGARAVDFEDPSLPQLRDIPATAGLTVHGVPVDENGIDVTALNSPAAVVTPAHQYPLGVTMRAARRSALIRTAKANDHLVVEDDHDGEFRFDRRPIGALQGLAPDQVVYAGTASKTLAPGLRLAWLVLPTRLVHPIRDLKATDDRHAPLFEQLTLAEFLTAGHYDQHVRRSRTVYRDRRRELIDAVTDSRAGHAVEPGGIAAGLHLTLRLDPSGPDEQRILRRMRRSSIDVDGLSPYWISREPHRGGLVIGYAAPAAGTFRAGLRALAHALGT